MLNSKSWFVIDKDKIPGNIHVVGVGASGSRLVENLVRLNLASKIIVYDMDEVEEKNLNNQAYLREHIGQPKVVALQDLCLKIDSTNKIRTQKRKVEYLNTTSKDVVFLLVDSFESRIQIMKSLTGNPLVITGGISSYGGNVEVARGENLKKLIAEYEALPPGGGEYDENDLTPCGSPISIYHRIGVVSSYMAEQMIESLERGGDFGYSISIDTPNLILMKHEI